MEQPQFFSPQQVLKAILKQEGIEDGHWGLVLNFGFSAGNVGPSAQDLKPGAILSIRAIGIQKTEEDNSLTVNLSPSKARSGKTKKSRK